MGKHYRSTALLWLLLTAASFQALANAGKVIHEPRPAGDLIEALKQGGYVVYMRHAATDHTQKDLDRSDLTNCTAQRNLSARGRDDAARIASIMRELGIPVSTVYSSPYCRARDTAAFLSDSVQIDPNLQFSISKDVEESARLGEYLYQKMLRQGDGNHHTLLHTSNLRDGLGIWPKPEGVMVVFRLSGGQLVYRGQISPDDWRS